MTELDLTGKESAEYRERKKALEEMKKAKAKAEDDGHAHHRTQKKKNEANRKLQRDDRNTLIAKVKVFAECMAKLVMECRTSQQYVDRDGIPTHRRVAKTSLRKV
jgi:hypothetical protein